MSSRNGAAINARKIQKEGVHKGCVARSWNTENEVTEGGLIVSFSLKSVAIKVDGA